MGKIIHITSTEKYLVDKRIENIKKKIGISNELNFLVTKSLEDLKNFSNTFSFFDMEDKLAIICDYDSEDLVEVIENSPDNMTLIIKGDLDKRKKLFKYLKKNKFVEDIKPYNRRDLCDWIIDEVKLLGSDISRANAMKILELTGETDMFNIYSQLVKVSFMREEITPALIDKVVTKSLLVNSFDLTNSILRKDINRSLEILDSLIKNSQEMIPLLALINKNFCIIKSLNEVHEDDLKENGINAFVIKNLRGYKNAFSSEQLEHYISLCQKLDYDLKNSYDPKMAMERLILNIY